MTILKASGNTEYGEANITVFGEKMVERIESDNPLSKHDLIESIREARSEIGNYFPQKNTMLQAYASLVRMFGESNITIDGELETMDCEQGVIY